MTIGIYKLVFDYTDKVYIGLSCNIEDRYKQHLYLLNAGKASAKLTEAYSTYGKPTITVLEVCSISDLAIKEKEYIDIYDSVYNGFNTSLGGMNNLPGELNPYSRYSNSFIEELFLYVHKNSEIPIRQIAKLFEIPYETLYDIVSGKTHVWLNEKYPEEYETILSMPGTRVKNNGKNVSNAEARGIVYPKLCDPDGTIYEITSFNRFMKEHELIGNSIRRLFSGRTRAYKGWTIHREA